MAFSTETVGKWFAEGRNYGSMALGLLTGIGVMSAAQQQGMADAVHQMYQGVLMIVSGATSFYQILIVVFPIVGVLLAKWAKKSASVDNQAAAVSAAVSDPNTKVSLQAKVDIANATANLPEVEKVVSPALAPLAVTVPAVVPK